MKGKECLVGEGIKVKVVGIVLWFRGKVVNVYYKYSWKIDAGFGSIGWDWGAGSSFESLYF